MAPPRFREPLIKPLTKVLVEALLKATEQCKESVTSRPKKFGMRRVTARRGRALILVLLDTDLRAREFWL